MKILTCPSYMYVAERKPKTQAKTRYHFDRSANNPAQTLSAPLQKSTIGLKRQKPEQVFQTSTNIWNKQVFTTAGRLCVLTAQIPSGSFQVSRCVVRTLVAQAVT